MNNKKETIFFVEDDRVDRMVFEKFAENTGFPYDYVLAGSVKEAMEILESQRFDAVVLDYFLGDGTAFDLFSIIDDETPIVIVTGTGDEEIAVNAMKAGASDYLIKDLESNYLKTLSATIERAIENKRNAIELKKYQWYLEDLVRERTAELEKEIETRRQTEEALRKSKDDLDKIINAVGDPIFVKDRQHRWVLLNDAFCEFMGYSRDKLLGRSDYDCFCADEADVFRAKDETVFATGEQNINEEQFTDAEKGVHTIVTKKTRYTDKSGNPYIVGVIRDITEHKNLEEQLRQAVKMEAVGALAGGVAHDFNNLITAILGYSDILLSRLAEDHPMRSELEEINKAAQRAASLTNQLLSFSHKKEVRPTALDLNEIVRETQNMLLRLIGEGIHLESRLTPELEPVMADTGMIEQLIVNLAINARDAMPRGGRLMIETFNEVVDKAGARRHLGLEPGSYVVLAVKDTGTGMDKPTLSRIFEPFFTTKEKGRGTGLGLATVYGIVKQLGGHIAVDSEPGRGTTFTIRLRRAEKI